MEYLIIHAETPNGEKAYLLYDGKTFLKAFDSIEDARKFVEDIENKEE